MLDVSSMRGIERPTELQVHDFLGEWRDTMGNTVTVEWAKNASGHLDVALSKKGRPMAHGWYRYMRYI